MKLARALLAAAIAVGAAVTIQLATSSPASAQQDSQLCGNCWHFHVD